VGTVYCQPSDLLNEINPFALQDISEPEQLAACVSASSQADDYLGIRGTLPVSAYPASVTHNVARIAIYTLLSARGYNPAAGADSKIKEDRDEALDWFNKIARQTITVAGLVWAVAMPGDPVHDLPQVISDPQRGWKTYSRSGRPSVW
jgi:phage gp36-like protein